MLIENTEHAAFRSAPDICIPGRGIRKEDAPTILAKLLGQLVWMSEDLENHWPGSMNLSRLREELCGFIGRLWTGSYEVEALSEIELKDIQKKLKGKLSKNPLLAAICEIAALDNTPVERLLLIYVSVASMRLIQGGKFRDSLKTGASRFKVMRLVGYRLPGLSDEFPTIRGMHAHLLRQLDNEQKLRPIAVLLSDGIKMPHKIKRGRAYKFEGDLQLDGGLRYQSALDLTRANKLAAHDGIYKTREIDDRGSRLMALVSETSEPPEEDIPNLVNVEITSASKSKRISQAIGKALAGCPMSKQLPSTETLGNVLSQLETPILRDEEGAILVALGVTTPISIEGWCVLLSEGGKEARNRIRELDDGRWLLICDAKCPRSDVAANDNVYFDTGDEICWPIPRSLKPGLAKLLRASRSWRCAPEKFLQLADESLESCNIDFRRKYIRPRLGRSLRGWLLRQDASLLGMKTKQIDSALQAIIMGDSKTDNPEVFYAINSQAMADRISDAYFEWLDGLANCSFSGFGPVAGHSEIYSGSNRVVTRTNVESYFKSLKASIVASVNEPLLYTSRLALLIYEIATLATAWRAEDGRLFTICCVDLHGRVIRVSDKQIRGRASDRELPMGAVLYDALTLWNKHLEIMASKYNYGETSIARACALAVDEFCSDWVEPSLGLVEGSRAYLFQLVNGSLRKSPLSCSSVRQMHEPHQFEAVMNWNRHLVRAYLGLVGVESHALNAYLGHPQRGHLAHGRHSAFSWAVYPRITAHIDALLTECGATPYGLPPILSRG